MPKVPILMPQLGESIAEATIQRILIQPGQKVQIDQEVLEVETNKATMGVTALCSGILSEIRVTEGETLAVGSLLGIIEADEAEIERTGVVPMDAPKAPIPNSAPTPTPQSTSKPAPKQTANSNPLRHPNNTSSQSDTGGAHFQSGGETYEERPKVQPNVRGLPVPASLQGANYLSPRMKARMDELGLRASDISAIVGSGAGGRVTIEDLEGYLKTIENAPRVPASPMRKAVADSMQRSWSRPLASAGCPCNVDNLYQHRRQSSPKASVTLYFMRALALALADMPSCAGYLLGDQIMQPKSIDIGIAVQIDNGVVVPVLRSVDKFPLSELIPAYNRLIHLARTRKLSREDCRGGITTITSFGGFGLTWAAPLPLPSESIILGIASCQKVPVWSEEVQTFVPVNQTQLVTSFDHRVIDGGDAGRLLNKIVRLIQRPWDL